MAINWGLLGQPVDVSAAVMGGFQQGRALKQQAAQQSAFAALAQNPTDQGAIAAVSAFDPRMGQQLRTAAREEQLRSGLSGAYDPNTGALDAPKVRAAYVAAGDVGAALDFDKSQADTQVKLAKQQREQIIIGARLLEGVTDDASFQRARQAAASFGIDISKIPDAYDPAYVEQVRNIADALDKQDPEKQFTLNPGAIRYDSNGNIIVQSPYAPTVTADGIVYERTPTAGTVADADPVFASLIQQESGGRAGITGPQTKYGQPMGMTQMLPDTAQEMARKIGLPWQPQMMSGKTPEAADYQTKLGRAYYEEGIAKYGGDQRKALMYYHGGPDESLWGPKTRAYADQVLARAEGRPAPMQAASNGVRAITPPKKEPPKPRPGYTKVASKAQYDALPSGSNYIAPDGSRRVKP